MTRFRSQSIVDVHSSLSDLYKNFPIKTKTIDDYIAEHSSYHLYHKGDSERMNTLIMDRDIQIYQQGICGNTRLTQYSLEVAMAQAIVDNSPTSKRLIKTAVKENIALRKRVKDEVMDTLLEICQQENLNLQDLETFSLKIQDLEPRSNAIASLIFFVLASNIISTNNREEIISLLEETLSFLHDNTQHEINQEMSDFLRPHFICEVFVRITPFFPSQLWSSFYSLFPVSSWLSRLVIHPHFSDHHMSLISPEIQSDQLAASIHDLIPFHLGATKEEQHATFANFFQVLQEHAPPELLDEEVHDVLMGLMAQIGYVEGLSAFPETFWPISLCLDCSLQDIQNFVNTDSIPTNQREYFERIVRIQSEQSEILEKDWQFIEEEIPLLFELHEHDEWSQFFKEERYFEAEELRWLFRYVKSHNVEKYEELFEQWLSDLCLFGDTDEILQRLGVGASEGSERTMTLYWEKGKDVFSQEEDSFVQQDFFYQVRDHLFQRGEHRRSFELSDTMQFEYVNSSNYNHWIQVFFPSHQDEEEWLLEHILNIGYEDVRNTVLCTLIESLYRLNKTSRAKEVMDALSENELFITIKLEIESMALQKDTEFWKNQDFVGIFLTIKDFEDVAELECKLISQLQHEIFNSKTSSFDVQGYYGQVLEQNSERVRVRCLQDLFTHAQLNLTEEQILWLLENDEGIGDDFERIEVRRAILHTIKNNNSLRLHIAKACTEMDYAERFFTLIYKDIQGKTSNQSFWNSIIQEFSSSSHLLQQFLSSELIEMIIKSILPNSTPTVHHIIDDCEDTDERIQYLLLLIFFLGTERKSDRQRAKHILEELQNGEDLEEPEEEDEEDYEEEDEDYEEEDEDYEEEDYEEEDNEFLHMLQLCNGTFSPDWSLAVSLSVVLNVFRFPISNGTKEAIQNGWKTYQEERDDPIAWETYMIKALVFEENDEAFEFERLWSVWSSMLEEDAFYINSLSENIYQMCIIKLNQGKAQPHLQQWIDILLESMQRLEDPELLSQHSIYLYIIFHALGDVVSGQHHLTNAVKYSSEVEDVEAWGELLIGTDYSSSHLYTPNQSENIGNLLKDDLPLFLSLVGELGRMSAPIILRSIPHLPIEEAHKLWMKCMGKTTMTDEYTNWLIQLSENQNIEQYMPLLQYGESIESAIDDVILPLSWYLIKNKQPNALEKFIFFTRKNPSLQEFVLQALQNIS